MPVADITIQVASPQPGAVLWGSTSGAWIDVSGTVRTVSAPGGKVSSVNVQLGGRPMGRAQLSGGGWSYRGLATTEGSLTITITATGWYWPSEAEPLDLSSTESVAVTVRFDRTKPQVAISPLPKDGMVYGPDALLEATIKGSAWDEHGIASVECGIDGKDFVQATPSPTAGWSDSTAICKVPPGIHSVTARAQDGFGNLETTPPVLIEGVDNTAPTVIVNEPPDYFTKLGDKTGAIIKVSGTATDLQSGVNSVWLTVDEKPEITQATPAADANWSTWSAEVKVPPDFHVIKVHARDNKNNLSAPKERPVRVSLSFKPGDEEDNVSPLAYLRDLLEFTRSHVTVSSWGSQPRPLELEDLAQEFFQPFGDLTSNEQVRQLRICIEILRAFSLPHRLTRLRTGNSTRVAAARYPMLRVRAAPEHCREGLPGAPARSETGRSPSTVRMTTCRWAPCPI